MVDNRVAIVTGGANGIGRAIAFALAEQGRIPVLFDINKEALAETEAELSELVEEVSSYVVDISDVAQLKKTVKDVFEKYGRVDILVNNAGILSTTPVENLSEEEWDRVFAINVKGPFFLSKFVLPYMVDAGFGRVINISSNSGRAGGISSGVAYSASKAGIIGTTRSMARKYAHTGVTFNTVAPGTVYSDIIKGFSDSEMKALEDGVPTKRIGKAVEIAAAVAYLASDLAGFTVGATIDVNGGLFIG